MYRTRPLGFHLKMVDNSLTSSLNINGIYIPAGLLVFGTAIVKREWTPYAALLAIVLGVWKLYSQRTFDCPAKAAGRTTNNTHRAQEGPQARRLPGVRARGEDHHLPQCSYVSSPHAPPAPTVC